MQYLKCTKKVDEAYGGIYRTPDFKASKGDLVRVSDAEAKRIGADHPGLFATVSDADAKKVLDAKAKKGKDAPEDDPDQSGPGEPVPGAKNRMLKQGRRK